MTPDFRGVLETDDGATILFEWSGFGRAGSNGARELVGRMAHLTDDPRYAWLNDRQCAVAGEVRPRAEGEGFDVVIDVAELVWEPLEEDAGLARGRTAGRHRRRRPAGLIVTGP